MLDQRVGSDSKRRRQCLHTKQSLMAMRVESLGVSENLDVGGGIYNDPSGLEV